MKEKRANYKNKTTNEAKNWKSIVIELTDEKTGQKVAAKMYTIGAVAKALGCSVQALRLWERKGKIPPAPYKYSKGDRLYNEEFIQTLKTILTKQGRIGPAATERVKSLPYLDRKVQFPSKTGRSKKGVVRNLRLYKIGLLAKAVGRTVVTLEQLEQRGALPKTPFKVSGVRYRLYTLEMMEAVKMAFEERAGEIRGKPAWAEFYDEIFEAWSELNVIGAWIIE
jgi:DNA-binding transcriptional MerR regulator